MKIRDDVVLGQHSHVGMARTENQDFFGFWEPDDDRTFDLKGRIVVVCDGMGGHAGGEIASRLAVKAILESYQNDPSGNVQEALRKALEAANSAIWKEGQREEKLRGMGSTCTTMVHRRDMVYFAQVGDSRGYLIRGGRIKQMTKDHSLVQQLVDEGLIDKSEMESHPDKNVILRSLGVKPEVEVDVSYVPAAAGDVYLLCSDGLSGPVSENEMLGIVNASNGEMRKACEALIDLANKYGGFDNITVQLLKVSRTDTATTDKSKEGTVTSSFTSDQVAASIAAARAAATAKGKPVPEKKDAKKGDAKDTKDSGLPGKPGSGDAKDEKKADADAEKGTKTEKLPSAKADSGAHPPLPKTAESPIPAGVETPASAGGGCAKLVVGLVLGLAIGAGGVIAATRAGVKIPGAERAAEPGEGIEVQILRAKDAEKAADLARARASKPEMQKHAAYARGDQEREEAKKAAGKGDYSGALAHYTAAAALYDVAAGGR